MSYFQYTQADLDEAFARGQAQVAGVLARHLEDFFAKLESEEPYHTDYVTEDLVAHVSRVCATYATAPRQDFVDHTFHYPEPFAPEQHPEEVLAAVETVVRSRFWGDLPRHEFNGENRVTPWRCDARIARRDEWDTRPCGFSKEHDIHWKEGEQ